MCLCVCVCQVFKDPVERPQQRGGPILSAEDSKSIFGNIPEILTVHQNIVVSIYSVHVCVHCKLYLISSISIQCTCT